MFCSMNNQIEPTRIAVRVYAPIERVFEFLTEKERVRSWYTFAEASTIEPFANGKYDFKNEGDLVICGKVVEFSKPNLLVYDFWFPGNSEVKSRVAWELQAIGPHEGSEDSTTFLKFEQSCEHDLSTGWMQLISALKSAIEAKDQP